MVNGLNPNKAEPHSVPHITQNLHKLETEIENPEHNRTSFQKVKQKKKNQRENNQGR